MVQLEDWTNSVGCFSSIQGTVSTSVPMNEVVDPNALLSNIVDSMAVRVTAVVNAAKRVRDEAAAAEAGSSGTASPVQKRQCCEVPRNGFFDWYYRTSVDNTTSCVRLPQGARVTDAAVVSWMDRTAGLDSVFADVSLNERQVAWAYYGGLTNGEYRIYPASYTANCGNYDPRRRPWWLQSVSVPRNVILLLDTKANNLLVFFFFFFFFFFFVFFFFFFFFFVFFFCFVFFCFVFFCFF
jgi:hypothetical protein